MYARQQFKCTESINQHCLLVTSINKSGNNDAVKKRTLFLHWMVKQI